MADFLRINSDQVWFIFVVGFRREITNNVTEIIILSIIFLKAYQYNEFLTTGANTLWKTNQKRYTRAFFLPPTRARKSLSIEELQ